MSLINNTTYTGKDLTEFFTDALLTGNSLAKFRLIPNAKQTQKIPSLNIGNVFQVGNDCGSSASGDVTLAQKSIEVCPVDVNVALCNGEWEGTFLSEYMKPGSTYAQTPEGMQEYILNVMKARISQQAEYMTWAGSTTASPAQVCDGIIKKLVADSEVIDASTATTLSKSNIVAELEEVYNLIPEEVLVQLASDGTTKVKIFISPAAARFYMQALYSTFPALNTTNTGEFKMYYLNTELVLAPGMPTNTMVAADPDNLIFATDLMDDMNTIEVKIDPTPGSKKTHFITSFKFGVDYAKGAEIVLYGTGS